MAHRLALSANIEDYVWAHTRQSDIAARLQAETAAMPQAGMQIGPDQAAFLALLVRSIGAQRCIEVGTFTGYSALAVAGALPEGGKLVCCDINAEWTAIARRYWDEAGVSARIELRLAPALDTLNTLLSRDGAAHCNPRLRALADEDAEARCGCVPCFELFCRFRLQSANSDFG